ncbi:MAG: nucleoside monophosphate kinase [Candidatus Saccharimonadales bacterium]
MNNDEKIVAIKDWLGSGSINIFGRPFSGKDTQGARLAELLNTRMIGGGEVLRSNNIPKRALECLHTGKLIPTEDYINIVLPFLSQSSLVGKPLVLSSIGRWKGEEQGVIKALSESLHQLKAVVYLDISTDDSFNRWKALGIVKDRQNRQDDTEEVLKTRFDEFQQKTIPVIEYYRMVGLLIEIDGTRTREEVNQDIIDALYSRATN